MTGEHAAAAMALPRAHGDPFDRILIAQAKVEGALLLTADAAMARYGAPVELAADPPVASRPARPHLIPSADRDDAP